MTTNQAAYAAMLALDSASSRRTDPVRSRVSGGAQLTNSQALSTGAVKLAESQTEKRGLHLLADTRGTGPRGPHPGDVIYWIACLGGACLLLLSATT